MARLKDAPKQGVRKPSSPSSDDDAAAQQLLAESRSPVADPPLSSAVLGASLLNAARINPPSSVPTRMVRKLGLGKLKRVSIKGECSRQNLARRGDPYEIELSPEKGRYALPEKVNHKPLKIVRKKKEKKRAAGEQREVPVASSELPVQVDQGEFVEALILAEPTVRSSPPEIAPVGSDNIVVHTTGQDRQPSEGDLHADALEDYGDTQATSKTNLEPDHSDRPSKIQREQRQMAGEPVSSRKTHPQVQIPVRRKSQKQKTTKKTRHNNDAQEMGSANVDSAQEEELHSDLVGQKTRSRRKRLNSTPVSRQQHPAAKRRFHSRTGPSKGAPETVEAVETGTVPIANESEFESDVERSGSVVDEADRRVRPTGQPGSFETVFEFLNLKAQPGKCQTELATSIRRKCKINSAHLQDNDLSMDTVLEDANELQESLKQIGTSVEEKDQRAFKCDAYGHVFRSLTLYLEALSTWLREKCGTVTESLEAMRILSPLIRQILVFKDTIADWNVSVSQRYKGERITKDVDISLIAQLRHVEKIYRRRLSRLEAIEQHRELEEDFERKMKEQADEEQRKAAMSEARTERWKRWQDLHIKRMLCEPDLRRRSKLTITKLEDLEERDANGVVFERLPVFKSRSAPLNRQAATLTESPEWTKQEETALLDGLKHCAGSQVFEKIFITYCRPSSSHPLGGHLRERSVAEIVTRAALFRSDLLKLYRENGWEVEDWITKIPVLL